MKDQSDQPVAEGSRKTSDMVEGWIGVLLAIALIGGIVVSPLFGKVARIASAIAGFN